jgi:cytochrome c553/cytochrome c2
MKIAFTIIGATVLALAALPRGEGQPQPPAPTNEWPQMLSPVVQTCVACHGSEGEGKPALSSPRIAGQSAHYIEKQLESYANGTRRHPVMEPIARGLSPQLRSAVAAHYARAAAPATASASPFTARWAERGRVTATQGDPTRSVQACDNCHGPGGIGQPPAIPYLAGLDDGYIRATLIAWKEGRRSNDGGQQMAVISKALSDDDVDAVARHYAGMAPPSPAPGDVVQAGRPQLMPPGSTRAMTVGTSVPEESGSEGRAPRAGGTLALGQSRGAANQPGSPDAGSLRGGAPNPTGSAGALAGLGDPARGRALVESGVYGCTACHTVPGIRSPRGIVGPTLSEFGGRPLLAGQLRNTPDVLVAFLRNPPSLVPATGMPNVGLGEEDARHVAAYLYTLAPDRH